MQEKLEHFSVFLERTDRLAEHLGLSLRDLANQIGISQAMLFGNRAGKYPISSKTWRKLEKAEKAAGLDVISSHFFRSQQSLHVIDSDEVESAVLVPDLQSCEKLLRRFRRQWIQKGNEYANLCDKLDLLRHLEEKDNARMTDIETWANERRLFLHLAFGPAALEMESMIPEPPPPMEVELEEKSSTKRKK